MRKGFNHTEETKKKMSDASKGIVVSEATREKISIANKGRRHTKESIKKMSDDRRGILKSESHKKALSISNKSKDKPDRQFSCDQINDMRSMSLLYSVSELSFIYGISPTYMGEIIAYRRYNNVFTLEELEENENI